MKTPHLMLLALSLAALLGSGNALAQPNGTEANQRAAERRARAEQRRAAMLAERKTTARFFEAIERNDIATVREMLEQGFRANSRNSLDQPDVLVAASKGHMEILAMLVEHGSTSTRRDRQWRTAIMAAIDNEQWDAVRFLARRENNLAPALHYAMKQNNQPAIDILFRLGPSPKPESPALGCAESLPEAQHDGDAGARGLLKALFRAIRDRQTAAAALLIDEGADVHGRDAHGNTPLHAAAYQGQLDIVRLLLKNGAAINARADRGKTPLMLAAQANAADVVRFLLEQGASANDGDNSGGTALMYAATAAATDVARLLLERGADVNARTANGNAALHCAIMAARKDEEAALPMVRLLVERGAQVNAGEPNDTGFSPLMWAAQARALRVATYLLEQGADVNAPGTGGETPLLWAAHCKHPELVRLLLDKGADVQAKNSHGHTALHHAAQRDAAECARLLIERGAPINAMTSHKVPPLILAIRARAIKTVEVLLELGADKEIRDLGGHTPLMQAAVSDSPELVELLLRHRADVKATKSDGYTILHCLVAADRKQARNVRTIISLLAENGADLHVSCKEAETPLIMAASHNRADIVRALMNIKSANYDKTDEPEQALGKAALHSAEALEYLLDRGVDINSRASHGETPLYRALHVLHPKPEQVRMLLERGADPDAANEHGETPLMWMAAKGNTDMAKLLLDHGAQLEIQDKLGRTALMLAAGNGQPEATALLLARGAQVNAQDKDGRPALSEAVRVHRFRGEKALQVAEILLKNGADLNLQREWRSLSPLEDALMRGGDEIALLLLRYCKDVHQRFGVQRRTALMLAARNESEPLCRELLRRGVDVNAEDTDKYTALLFAVNSKDVDIVRLLLEHGANANAKDKLGYTPLMRAQIERKHAGGAKTHRKIDEIERLLREHGARE